MAKKIEVINESVLINRDNIIEFLKKLLTSKDIENDEVRTELIKNFDRFVGYNPPK